MEREQSKEYKAKRTEQRVSPLLIRVALFSFLFSYNAYTMFTGYKILNAIMQKAEHICAPLFLYYEVNYLT